MLPGWIRWHEHSCPRSRRRARRADALVCPAEQGSATSWLASSALHLVPRFAEQVSFRRSRRGRRPRLPGRAKLGCSARVAACMWGASANFPNPPPPPGARSRSTFTTHWAARTSWAIRPSAATRTTASAVPISCSCGKVLSREQESCGADTPVRRF